MSDHLTPASETAPSTDASGPSRTAREGLIAGLVVGLLVGGGGVALAWALTSGAPDDAAERDATTACQAIEDSALPSDDPDEMPLDVLRRWSGAGELAAAAAEADSTFQELADEFNVVNQGARAFQFDEVDDAAQNVEELCADL